MTMSGCGVNRGKGGDLADELSASNLPRTLMSAPLIAPNDGNTIPALGLGQSASTSALSTLIVSTPDQCHRARVKERV